MNMPFLAGCRAPRRTAFIAAGVAGTLALLMFAPSPALAQNAPNKDPLVAKVNGVEIHQSDLTLAEESVGQIPPMSAAAKKDYLVQFTADMILVSKAAADKKLNDTATFKQHLEFLRRRLLMESLLEEVGKAAVTDAAMHEVYDDAVKQMHQQEEVRARHILIRAKPGDEKSSAAAKAKIEAIIAKLKKGADFATLAKENTEDPSGKANGGDLGYFTKDQMVPTFADVAFKLKKGEISGPVKTQFGWHVIKIEDRRIKPLPTFTAVKAQLVNYLTRKAQAALVQKLRAGAKIEKFYKTADATKKSEPVKNSAPAKK